VYCVDSSDEIGCNCTEDEFTCDCVTQRTCTSLDGCLKKSVIVNGFYHCPDERIRWGKHGRIEVHRLNDVSECTATGSPKCDSSTCYHSNFSTCVADKCFSSHVICTSYCDNEKLCNGVFQCNDNRLIFRSQFCDGIVDCFDSSDEITNQPGFKCNKCVLPQSNLYDDFAHCDNNSDLCFVNGNCFQCFDKRLLISSQQVCDGVSDCYDMSDECLCEKYFDTEECRNGFEDAESQCFDNKYIKLQNNLFSLMTPYLTPTRENSYHACLTKHNATIFSTVCDGRPECKDFSDECHCPNPPHFCNDSCHSYFPMGNRYCDGVEDPAWQYINKSECPRGFDEINCPKRFRCNATSKISIDIMQVCDGFVDCDDGSDERGCPIVAIQRIFSSSTEMIANPSIKSCFWIMGILVTFGNAYVIITVIAFLKKNKAQESIKFHQFIILNISIADFIMGIYLLTIASYDTYFSGYYGEIDDEWRSSLKCSIIGSLAIISSETSCFIMVILTAFRFRNIFKALEPFFFALHPWIICIILAWLCSIFIGAFRILNFTSQYFLHSFSYSSAFQHDEYYENKLTQFACRFAALSNTTVKFTSNEFQSVETFVRESFLPDNFSIKLFGYYGATSVCMPRFYVSIGESSWEFTIALISINFLCFLFIAVSYVVIYKNFSASAASLQSHRSRKENTRMQKRIARIIATDFCCWIPICIMAYLRLGLEFSVTAYQISAVLLLPINSAINPLLFSSLPYKIIKAFSFIFQKSKQIYSGIKCREILKK